MNLDDILNKIEKPSEEAIKESRKRWDSISKPLRSLGLLEEAIIKIAGIQKNSKVDINKKALIVMCADNGVVEEGVTQTGQEVTAIVAENMVKGDTSVHNMAKCANVDVIPVDIGIARDMHIDGLIENKLMYGTNNMTKEPAMAKDTAIEAIECGIRIVKDLKDKGYGIIATGEMGIGNTTTSSAVASVLLNQPVEKMTGRGAGLSSEGLLRKIRTIEKAIQLNQPDPEDPVDVLAKVGGLDIAGLTGVYLGGAALGMPVVMDGFISCVAALIAMKLCPTAGDYILASHVSKEPAAHLILEHMGKEAILHADMCLGEGSGAVALFPFLDMGVAVYESISTFEDIHVEQYKELV